jgi:hypothetical protein
MYSWKAIRTFCLVLLLIPVAHLVYLVSSDMVAAMNPSPDVWEHEIEAYGRADRAAPLPDTPIVVVGGMRVKLWQDLEQLLAPRAVLMRGIGGAIVEDIIHNHERLIGYYRPDSVVLLPDNAEFQIRDSKSARELLASIQELVQLDEAHHVTRHFYVIAPIKTLLYPADHAVIDEVTDMLLEWSAQDPKVTILDANPLLQGEDLKPRASYFRADGVHLNEHGYLRLSTLVQNHVEQASCCGY